MAEAVELLIYGERFSGFRSGSVTQSFAEQLTASTFEVQYSSRADELVARLEAAWSIVIEGGDAVTIRVGDEDLVRGYVDQPRERYDATQIGYSVAGSSRLADLLDCSAVARSRRFRDQTLFQITQALLDGYEIVVHDRAVEDEPLERFAIQEGETIAEALGRAARLRGVVLADEGGDLVLTRVGATTTTTRLERGVNVLSGERSYSWRERFSEYRFRGQTRATDEMYGLRASQIGQTVEDRGVTRKRVLVVHAHTDRREDIGRRAITERNARAGRSERLVYEVAGWTNAEGLWRPNVRVHVLDDWLGIDAKLLIVRVTHTFNTQRYRTQIELTRPEAFGELDFPIRPRGGQWR